MEQNYEEHRHIQQQFSNSEAFKNAYAQILSQIAQLLFLQFCSLVLNYFCMMLGISRKNLALLNENNTQSTVGKASILTL